MKEERGNEIKFTKQLLHKEKENMLGNKKASSSKHPMSQCGDCGASNPHWASINRGVLLCSDCCSVHRSLGRHVSQIKWAGPSSNNSSSFWVPEQLTMVHSLYSCGANSIWEYSLLNPSDYQHQHPTRSSSSSDFSKMRKPRPSDALHPTKSDFIRAKHLQLAFVFRHSNKEQEPPTSAVELSRQLHSSVRTNNLETSLRLLSQGADPNYYHTEKNSTPLQVACRAGQASQVELLLVYGADPGAVDKSGRTAPDYARAAGHSSIGTRVNNAQFEVSDRLSFYLCQRRPDHGQGQHFIIPDANTNNNIKLGSHFEEAKVAKRRLQGLSNGVFEELAMDVYDEVDRRETDAIWASIEAKATGSGAAAAAVCLPFLPVNPDYGTTRNQARQKLARLDRQEFATLTTDVLKEIRRRSLEMGTVSSKRSPLRENPPHFRGPQHKSLPAGRLIRSTASDDEPIYDHVASDDDYYHIPETPSTAEEDNDMVSSSFRSGTNNSTLPRARPASGHNNVLGGGSSLQSSPAKSSSGHTSEFLQLKHQLESSEMRVQALIDSNDDMRGEISRLSSMVNKLVNENHVLRVTNSPVHSFCSNENEYATPQHQQQKPPPPVRSATTVSMYEQRRLMNTPPSPAPPIVASNSSGPTSLPSSSFMSSRNLHNPVSTFTNTTPYYEGGSLSLPSAGYEDQQQTPVSLPSQEEVVRRTEAITRCIQELLISAKDEKFDAFIPCSERIVRAVTDMVALFPSHEEAGGDDDAPWGRTPLGVSLADLMAAAQHFETECRILIARSQKEPLHQGFVTQQVMQCAFDIAKSTKQLVAMFQ